MAGTCLTPGASPGPSAPPACLGGSGCRPGRRQDSGLRALHRGEAPPGPPGRMRTGPRVGVGGARTYRAEVLHGVADVEHGGHGGPGSPGSWGAAGRGMGLGGRGARGLGGRGPPSRGRSRARGPSVGAASRSVSLSPVHAPHRTAQRLPPRSADLLAAARAGLGLPTAASGRRGGRGGVGGRLRSPSRSSSDAAHRAPWGPLASAPEQRGPARARETAVGKAGPPQREGMVSRPWSPWRSHLPPARATWGSTVATPKGRSERADTRGDWTPPGSCGEPGHGVSSLAGPRAADGG